ncbi:hypothetical protein BSL78_17768 [Apostichopus japonicus]|uniref:ISXO2-like transposase domain-containing protein n=1 Tax=Stichopus japonicus TaxID=307972 RepID=A0A2G8KBG7_STIJA|nr:hypothetical protein BSL78_17768 [Apostichopus japonicus]
MSTSSQIGGSGIHVEIDESKFGNGSIIGEESKTDSGFLEAERWKKGKMLWCQLRKGMRPPFLHSGREVEEGQNVMVPVEKRDETTLLTLIKKWIRPGSIIHSNCWKAYDCLSKEGYTHLKVNHSVEFVNAETGACTNHIENEWLHAKKS